MDRGACRAVAQRVEWVRQDVATQQQLGRRSQVSLASPAPQGQRTPAVLELARSFLQTC